MRRERYNRMLAAGLAGLLLATGGCAGRGPASGGPAAAETEARESGADGTEAPGAGADGTKAPAGSSAENAPADDAESGEGTADPARAPGTVWFDKDTGAAHGDIADTSAKGETKAGAGEEADVNVPVKIWGTVSSVEENGLTVDNQSPASASGEMIIHVDPEQTVVVDPEGLPVDLADVETGSFVAYLGPEMTMSLPPQVTARVVIVNIPEDAETPEYVVAADKIADTEEGKVLESLDGERYALAEDVAVEPYLTRNIVTLEDIAENSRCLLWMDPSGGAVTRIVLFAAE